MPVGRSGQQEDYRLANWRDRCQEGTKGRSRIAGYQLEWLKLKQIRQ